MRGFTYKGKSTNTILNTKLVLATFDEETEVVGHDRELVNGDVSMTRQSPNEYGTIYSLPSYSYSLIKVDNTPFTEEEQIAVERWLTSPKYSSDLDLFDCSDGYTINTYKGKFTHTEWVVTAGGYAAVTFTFQCARPYPIRRNSFSWTGTNETVTLHCNSDELEEYVYPTIHLYAPNSTTKLNIQNLSDNNNIMTINVPHRLNLNIDCDICMLTDNATATIVNFSDLGWEDIGNIYWLRLVTGDNRLLFYSESSSVQVTISYEEVCKKVGGWL